jgi:hypothetical protein
MGDSTGYLQLMATDEGLAGGAVAHPPAVQRRRAAAGVNVPRLDLMAHLGVEFGRRPARRASLPDHYVAVARFRSCGNRGARFLLAFTVPRHVEFVDGGRVSPSKGEET